MLYSPVYNFPTPSQEMNSHIMFLIVCLGNVYRECHLNGSWAGRGDYTQCQEILKQEVRQTKEISLLEKSQSSFDG